MRLTTIALYFVAILVGGLHCSTDPDESPALDDSVVDVSQTTDGEREERSLPEDLTIADGVTDVSLQDGTLDIRMPDVLPDGEEGVELKDAQTVPDQMLIEVAADFVAPDVLDEEDGGAKLCTPMATQCGDETTLMTCQEDGMDWISQECPAEHFCLDGTCLEWVCFPGEPVCDGSMATVCSEYGSGPAEGGQDCQESGTFCIVGECIKCYPDCFGKMCGDDGCGGSCGDCDDDNVCTTDSCNAGLYVCGHAPVDDCCLAAEDCVDGESCTIDACIDNACDYTYICCESHEDCDDEIGSCTLDLCLNNYCWNKKVPAESCCPHYDLAESFELPSVWNWSLSEDGKKFWTVADGAARTGVNSLKCDKANNGSVASLPDVLLSGPSASLEFWYQTAGWVDIDCQLDGLKVIVNDVQVAEICEPQPEWTHITVALDSWLGQEPEIKLLYDVNPWNNPVSVIRLDDVSIVQPCCASDLGCDDGNPCTEDTCDVDGTCASAPIAGCCHPPMFQDDFESGTLWGWSVSADGKKKWQLTAEDAHIGQYSLLGSETHNGAICTLPEEYSVPVTGATLKFWHKTVDWNVITWGIDGITVIVNGQTVSVISTPSPEWSLHELDLSAWAGKEITVQLRYSVVAAGNKGHRVHIDDLQLVRHCCELDSECDDGNECTEDTCGVWGGCIQEQDPGCCGPEVFVDDFEGGTAWGWSLSLDGQLVWTVVDDQAHSGDYSLYCDGYENAAVATVPLKPTIPWSGASLQFHYKTANWNTLDCGADGIAVFVNGARAAAACEQAAEWTLFEADLGPWAGQTVELLLKYALVTPGNNGHKAWLDDVQFVVECCSEDADCSDDNPCTADACDGEVCMHEEDPECCNPSMYAQGFEFGSAWKWSLSKDGSKKWQVTNEVAYQGLSALRTGEYNNLAVASLPTLGPIPYPGASLQFHYKTAGWVALNCDTDGLVVTVNGVKAGSACTASEEDWSLFSVDLTPWGGKMVEIQVGYVVPVGNPGNKGWLDEVQLVANCCSANAECDDGDPCTEDSCTAGDQCVYAADEGCCTPGLFEEGFELGNAWGWSLSADGVFAWTVTSADAGSGKYSLSAGLATNSATVTLPPPPAVPWTGASLEFIYRTENWTVLDCAWMGLHVFVNGNPVDTICTGSPDWTKYSLSLAPWAGQTPEIKLKYHVGNNGNPNHRAYIDDVGIAANCP